jgi:predicted extracellular nuclease
VGYLLRGDRANMLSVEQFPAPEGLTSRPPLLLVVEVSYGGTTEILYVLNNHFTALSGGELATEPRRTAQAAWNAEVLEGLLAADPAGHGVVMGDLNSFYGTPPIEVLEAIGLQHVFDPLAPDERYTYIYQGISQTLDHILVTPDLMARLLRVDMLRTNTDFAPPIPGDDSPLRKSDHDAVVVVFSLEP